MLAFLAGMLLALAVFAADALWHRRREILRSLVHALACVWVLAEFTYRAGRSCRASLARLGVTVSTPALPDVEALRLALVRFLARHYRWRAA